jgi:hypothetical protein
MMRMSCRWTGLRAGVLALGFVALAAGSGRADAIMNYSTAGSIDVSHGVSGAGVISFIPVTENQFNAPSAFSLGDFQVAALHDGQSTTYSNTPFSITYLTNSVNGVAPNPTDKPIVLTGVLNGTITGSNQSDVVAKFDPIANPTFMTGDYKNTLSFTDNPLSLVPSTTNNGKTSAQARLDTVFTPTPPSNTIPEPTSIALFLTTLAGLGVRHRVRARRAA